MPTSLDLANDYVHMGQWDKALAKYQEGVRLPGAGSVLGYADLGVTYLSLNRLEEAKSTFDEALAHKMDGGFLRQNIYTACFSAGGCFANGSAIGLGCWQTRR